MSTSPNDDEEIKKDKPTDNGVGVSWRMRGGNHHIEEGKTSPPFILTLEY